MTQKLRLRTLASACFAACALVGSQDALAQAPPLSESIIIGAWTFRPSLEARLRGEFRNEPFGFDQPYAYQTAAVLADEYNSNLPPRGFPVSTPLATVTDVWSVTERVRLGLAVDRGPVTAVVKLQDARVLGGTFNSGSIPYFVDAGPGYGFGAYEAYLDIHARSGRAMFLRLGRQAVSWGDGRLIGTNDFALAGRSLDAARFGVEVGDFDIETLAALIGVPTLEGGFGPTGGALFGAQLYGVKVTGHFLPMLQLEATGLARIGRQSTVTLTPSDVFVADGRVFGSYRGFRYSAEVAYQGGQVASYGVNRPIDAFALAGRFEWETALPWHFTLGAQGAYATGDNGTGSPDETMTRFDPILPDQTINHSRMSLYAWSNLIEAGADLSVRPSEEVGIGAGYRFVGLANPKGRWITGALNTVGADPDNDSMFLGNEIDATIRVTPWDPISFQAGYGLFLLGEGGRNILVAAGRPAEMQHWGYLQMTVKAP